MNGRYLNRRDYYAVPTDGYNSRDVQRALMFAIQYELDMDDGVANGNFGPGTKAGLQAHAHLTLGSTDTTKYFVHLFQAALLFNGYSVTYDGIFGPGTRARTILFQEFVALAQSGTANMPTWGSLLVSHGDPDRPGTGADCVTTLDAAKLSTLRAAGYTHFGRYLMNTPDDIPEKCIKPGELQRVFDSGGRVFPLFQTGGSELVHFTKKRGRDVGEEAANAAWAYRIPANTVIYFSVDFDVYDQQITDQVIPYFQGVHETIGITGRNFRVGIYGPRNACSRISAAGLAEFSFVSDMSTGYVGNIGFSLPTNWAFDQIQTRTVGSGSAAIEIDKNIVSGRENGITTLAPAIGAGNDPRIPAAQLDAFEAAWFGACKRYPDSDAQSVVMDLNRATVKSRVWAHDQLITNLAAQFGVYKALIMTPLIWESMVINAGDDIQDGRVIAFYAALLQGQAPPAGSVPDSSTGPCQIKAETAIKARNWAVGQGLLSSRLYDFGVWQDVWEIWYNLNTDEAFNITTGMYVMMYEANRMAALTPTQLRGITPSQVQRMCFGYNGDMIYGRNRTALYYTIQRWEESFR